MTADREHNARLDEAISVAANTTNFAAHILAQGRSVVLLDDDGQLVVQHPPAPGGTEPLRGDRP